MSRSPNSLLTTKIKLRDKHAFDMLFFRYYSPLYHYALNFCSDSIIAEESVQNTFIKIWNNCTEPDFNDIGKILFTYTKNNVIDEIRKNSARKKHEGLLVSEMIVNESIEEDTKFQIKAIIESGIEKLPKKAKEIFRLAKQEGLSIKEIADYLKISNKTVENQLTIAYKKLRTYLEPFKNQLTY